jgi:molybdate transport system substrate-binding protein
LLVAVLLLTGIAGCGKAESVTLNVSAAASMTDALAEVNDLYMQENSNVTIMENFASSGTLQTQIENGAPVDVFISAASKQMNTLEEKELILNDTRKNLLNNKVVLIVPEDSKLNISDFKDLVNADVKQIALGDPEFVPAGNYGKQVLDLLDIYGQVESKLILGSDVRQVLNYVETGNVDAGIVYSTDAAISTSSKVVADAPDEINAKIVYPVAVVKTSTNVEASNEYIDFLFGDGAAAIFEKYGFSMIGK